MGRGRIFYQSGEAVEAARVAQGAAEKTERQTRFRRIYMVLPDSVSSAEVDSIIAGIAAGKTDAWIALTILDARYAKGEK